MARRGGNEGSIYQRRDGRWTAVVHVGYEGGRRRRKAYYGPTRQAVAERLAAAVRDQQLGRQPVPEKEKLGDFLTRWLHDVVRPAIRATSYTSYEVRLRLDILPSLGHIRLSRLTADDLDRLYARLLDKGLSPKTIKLAHSIVRKALAHAQRRGAVATNVAAVVTPPRVVRKEFRCLSPGEVGRLLKASQGDPLHALYVIAVTCGLRSGEIRGLRWADLDLDAAELHIRQQVNWLEGAWQFTEPKTSQSRRTVSLSAMAVDALREHRKAQVAERIKAKDWPDLDLVFTNASGNPIERQNLLRRSFHPLLERAGLPRVRFHDLRHSAATLMLQADVHPKIVSEMLGHANVGVTLDTYSHVLPSMGADAAEKMERLLVAKAVER